MLASILDGVRGSGNRDVHVRMTNTPRGKRLGPLHVHLEEDVEAIHLRFLIAANSNKKAEALERLNANVPYSGLVYSVNQAVSIFSYSRHI